MTDVRQELLAESVPKLVDQLRQEIQEHGGITFARFMELAVAHPEYGYYATGDSRAGTEGDFVTAPEMHPIFGWTLARQVAECWDRLERPEPFTIREIGAGRGALARTLLGGLWREREDAFSAVRYELDDLNEQRVAEALSMLDDAGFGDRVSRTGSAPVTGIVLANELLDAFPVHRLIWSEGTLQEIYVTWRDGWFADEPGPLSDLRLRRPLQNIELQEGQQVEVSPLAHDWARTLGERIERGYAILIDYGYPADELYVSERYEGTLKGYSGHVVTADPYRKVGNQDLTAHVDFTAVTEAARESGCIELGLTTQAHFFAGLGIEEILMDIQQTGTDPYDYINARETVMHLIDPRGLGRFRVLVLGKEVPRDPPLRGLSFRGP